MIQGQCSVQNSKPIGQCMVDLESLPGLSQNFFPSCDASIDGETVVFMSIVDLDVVGDI